MTAQAQRSAPPAASDRLLMLDGLRGLAAVVVVLFHVTEIARPVLRTEAPLAGLLLTQSPLKLLTVGTEAVLVFFVLSGLVVALPALRERFSWPAFFASRLIRLYLPVWAILLIVVVIVTVIPRDPGAVTADSWIANATVTTIELPRLLSEASLMRGSYDIVAVLWSLRWEVIFSVTLPAFVAVALLVRRWWLPVAIACAAMSVVGRMIGNGYLLFLPLFFVGTLLATQLGPFRAWAAERERTRLWVGVLAGSCALLVVNWIVRPLVPSGTPVNVALYGLAGAGAIGIVLVALGWSPAGRQLSRPVMQWLGRVSFSLYLVHVPVLTTLAYALGDDRWWLAAVLGVPGSFVAAEVFYRLIERPSHRLARRTASAIRSRRPSPSALVEDSRGLAR